MKFESLAGPQALSDGALDAVRLGRTGEQIVTELHGKYYEQTFRGRLFHATLLTAGAALAVAGTTAGIALYNPAGASGGVNVSLVRVAFGIVSGTYVPGTIMHGVNNNVNAAATTGTALVALPGLIGGSAVPSARPFSGATLPVAQTALRPFANKTATPSFGPIAEDVDGQIVLAPGTTWSLFVVGADTTPLEIVSVTWEEIPV